MTKQEWAQKLNGREYGEEISDAENKKLKADGLVAVFGYSDDNAEFRGAFHDEIGSFGGINIYVNKDGVLPEHEHDCECPFCGYKEAKEKSKLIETVWGKDGYSWTYKTDIPHATFDILEDGEKFCRGIVFEVASLKLNQSPENPS